MYLNPMSNGIINKFDLSIIKWINESIYAKINQQCLNLHSRFLANNSALAFQEIANIDARLKDHKITDFNTQLYSIYRLIVFLSLYGFCHLQHRTYYLAWPSSLGFAHKNHNTEWNRKWIKAALYVITCVSIRFNIYRCQTLEYIYIYI